MAFPQGTPAHSRRNFHRIVFKGHARVQDGEHTWICEILNLSLKGCLLGFPDLHEIKLHRSYQIDFSLDRPASLSMTARLVHLSGNQAGFSCEHIDLDSATTLRRVVELNLGDSDLLEKDLAALINESNRSN